MTYHFIKKELPRLISEAIPGQYYPNQSMNNCGINSKNIAEVKNMAVAHKGAISFGLVNIPAGLYGATEDSGVAFTQLHKDCRACIRHKKTCPACNIEEVKPEDIANGLT